ncbi:MAG: lipoprotein insertase outer membrane protein LolB [Granulosicoccus sp.]|nr:lipoprotein insertase outer membrane protein LolB [Granulosicoccus sp.]
MIGCSPASGCVRWRLSQAFAVTLLLCSFLQACATPSPIIQPPDVTVAERDAQLAAIDAFEFRGGLGVWSDQQSISARINWQQQPGQLRVDLTAPLGIGDMLLTSENGMANLQRGDKTLASGPSVDQVLQQGLGLGAKVPVGQLQLWIKGLPGEAQSINRDDNGRLASLQYQDDTGIRWQARFRSYKLVEDVALPSLITASGGQYSVRLVLKSWVIDTPPVVPGVHESNKRLAIPGR